ncbi:MAG TPA: DUF2891 domain-containing protein [Chitinophagaceae bacterium]|nr:DUF2891 domain-containing protein [Chitinophagaceae bacterium]
MKQYPVIFLLIATLQTLNAQKPELFRIRKDSSGFELTLKGASHLASLPLKCIRQEWPNKTSHVSNTESDHTMLPSQLHPAFFGCFDWHSSVHGHWMLVKLLKTFPDLPEADSIRKILQQSINPENIEKETAYFSLPLTNTWERTYGWAWLLKLDEELYTWNDSQGRALFDALQPLTKKIVALWKAFLPKQTYANRTGVHPNTAFGLVFALDYARAIKDTVFENDIEEATLRLFGKDKNAPALWEPNTADFLSPTLEEADLLRKVLTPAQFLKWFNSFLPSAALKHLSSPPVVSDRNDLQIVHLDGLCFSRSWCMQGLANKLPVKDPRKKILLKASINHLAAALPQVVSGEYGGEHWLASFAVYALLHQEK